MRHHSSTSRSKTAVTGISFFVGAITFSFLALVEWFILPDFGFAYTQAFSASELIRNLTNPGVLVAILYAGLFVSVIGSTAYIKAQEGIKAARASLICYMAPIVSLPLAFLFLAETITLIQLAGVGVVLLGVVITELHWERLDTLHFSSPKTVLNFVKNRILNRAILNRRFKRQVVPPTLP